MEWIKTIHITCVILSFCGFFLRGVWMLSNSKQLQKRWVKTVPHVVDAILLGSALIMLYLLQLSVLDHQWLQAKIGALLVYIGLGALALKPGRSKTLRRGAWLAALLVFLYIVSVALTKLATGFFAWI